MKYLKKFEYAYEEYEIGDYVLINWSLIRNNFSKFNTIEIDNFYSNPNTIEMNEIYAKIIKYHKSKDDEDDDYKNFYTISFSNHTELNDVTSKYIIRKLTETEVEVFHLQEVTNKFNI